MTFLAPWVLVAAAGAAALVTALHLLARARPRGATLPTARFVPDSAASATVRAPRARDLPLLALRVAALLLAGAAFARPVPRPARRAAARVVAVDLSRSVADAGAARDSALAHLRAGDALVVFDRVARAVGGAARDSIRALPAGAGPGSLSAALAAAARAAGALPTSADSVDLVLVSAFAREEWDDATAAVRAAWTGRVRLVRVAAAGAPPDGSVSLAGAAEDPLRATVALLGARGGGAEARIVRDAPTVGDSAWARASGHVLVRWPVDPAAAFGARAHPDTVGAVLAGDAVLVALLPRMATAPRAARARAVAWWVDGEPAATERPAGDGCVRDVAIALPARGDLVLGEGARRLVRALTTPCGGARSLAPLSDSALAVLRDTGGDGPPPRAPDPAPAGPLAAWLLGAAALALLAEMLVRRRGAAS